jgi:hypothetical protein
LTLHCTQVLGIWTCFLDDATAQSWLMIGYTNLNILGFVMIMSIAYLQLCVKKMIVKESNNENVQESVNVQMRKGAGRLRIQYILIFGIGISCTLPPGFALIASLRASPCYCHSCCVWRSHFLRARDASLHFGVYSLCFFDAQRVESGDCHVETAGRTPRPRHCRSDPTRDAGFGVWSRTSPFPPFAVTAVNGTFTRLPML